MVIHIIRGFIEAAFVVGVYIETGPFTAAAILHITLSMELLAYSVRSKKR